MATTNEQQSTATATTNERKSRPMVLPPRGEPVPREKMTFREQMRLRKLDPAFAAKLETEAWAEG